MVVLPTIYSLAGQQRGIAFKSKIYTYNYQLQLNGSNSLKLHKQKKAKGVFVKHSKVYLLNLKCFIPDLNFRHS
jgi:hypothetical protein